MSLIRLALLVAVWAWSVHAGESGTMRAAEAGVSPAFCSALQAIVGAAPTGFTALRGSPQDGSEHVWQGTRQLSDRGSCLVLGGKPPAYMCTLYAGDDEDNADSAYDRAVAAVKDCLAGTWKATENVSGSHVRTTLATGPGAALVRVVSHDVSGDAWLVELWIDAGK